MGEACPRKPSLSGLLKAYRYVLANKDCEGKGCKQPKYPSRLSFNLQEFHRPSLPLLRPSSLIYCSLLLFLIEPPGLVSHVKGVKSFLQACWILSEAWVSKTMPQKMSKMRHLANDHSHLKQPIHLGDILKEKASTKPHGRYPAPHWRVNGWSWKH